MSDSVHLIIVTDNPKEASLSLLGCAVERLPAWIRVMSGPEISGLPENAPVLAIWFHDGSLAETLYRERRSDVRLDNDYGKHYARLSDWRQRRDVAEQVLIKEHCAEIEPSSHDPAQDGTGMAASDGAQAALSRSPVQPSPKKRQSKWT